MMVRTFICLHLVGPAMGQSVILFLWGASKSIGWEFWTIEASVAGFWLLPLMVKMTRSLVWPATISVQLLVFMSLFGSFNYGGISSPFLPWFLIALLTGFFYLAERVRMVLIGVIAQMTAFVAARLLLGHFPELLPLSSLTYVNLLSLLSALVYVTILSLYYEKVMRVSAELEKATHEHRAQTDALREAFKNTELASQQKSIFLSKMSHELRTPLNAVIGYSEMLHENLGDQPANPQRAQDLKRINAAGRHLLALVTDILDLSRIETNRVEISITEVELAQLVHDVIAATAPVIAKKGNRLVLDMPVDPGKVMADALKLRQSILNLLSNAAKFTSQGTITLTVHKGPESSGRMLIKVRDTGIGMSEDGMKKLFLDFTQVEDDTSHKFGGTGLGLALTRRFCTLMGGGITAESKLGEGSCFTIDIPCARKTVQESHSDQSSIRPSLLGHAAI
ncbi:hypothetical protein ABENE_16505 [Asticcacaulis benevestitus DSM 16100 = ATCC BAA-896]|uniref:histidine kinase n=2 Tax=Asticcacaulis TaxID=76890 RepID=V4PRK6_9CAUL|nr:hypothetical protein ABENE_16505 [Asticcacaulis benevestitus DSM 16100 = ATCC BAA-896]